MVDTENKKVEIKRRKSRKKKKFGYLYLFVLVFLIALSGLSFFVKSFSPDVDVSIGNNEALTLGEEEMNMEVKPVDERLKWIQMEDEMPSVAIRNPEADRNFSFNEEEETPKVSKTIKNLEEQISLEEQNIEKQEVIENPVLVPQNSIASTPVSPKQVVAPDFRQITPVVPVIPLPKPILTKVYIGSFISLEEAMAVQNKVTIEESSIIPFIKAIGSTYVVQIGSFSEQEKANALAEKMKNKGYSVKVISEN